MKTARDTSSLVTLGDWLGHAERLYAKANPSRGMLAAHDALLFLSAIAGALAAAWWLPV